MGLGTVAQATGDLGAGLIRWSRGAVNMHAVTCLPAVTGGRIKFGVAGSGEVHAAGKADSVEISIAGSGDVDARGLAARTADVSIAGSGNVTANASETADVSIMGSGDVDLTGGAKCTVSKAGSGNVRCG